MNKVMTIVYISCFAILWIILYLILGRIEALEMKNTTIMKIVCSDHADRPECNDFLPKNEVTVLSEVKVEPLTTSQDQEVQPVEVQSTGDEIIRRLHKHKLPKSLDDKENGKVNLSPEMLKVLDEKPVTREQSIHERYEPTGRIGETYKSKVTIPTEMLEAGDAEEDQIPKLLKLNQPSSVTEINH